MLFPVATIFCLHPSQIVLKYFSDIYCFKKIPTEILFPLAHTISSLKFNYHFPLSIGGFNQYPPPVLENICKLIDSEDEEDQNIGLPWVRKLWYLSVTFDWLSGV